MAIYGFGGFEVAGGAGGAGVGGVSLVSASCWHPTLVPPRWKECESNGPVADIKIPRDGALKGACFVRFVDQSGSSKARKSLHQRQFDGNTVTATFITVEDMPQ